MERSLLTTIAHLVQHRPLGVVSLAALGIAAAVRVVAADDVPEEALLPVGDRLRHALLHAPLQRGTILDNTVEVVPGRLR